MLNVVLGGVLDGRLLLAHARQNDGLWRDAVFKHEAYFSLADKGAGSGGKEKGCLENGRRKPLKAPEKPTKNVQQVLHNLRASLAAYQSTKCFA